MGVRSSADEVIGQRRVKKINSSFDETLGELGGMNENCPSIFEDWYLKMDIHTF